MPAYREIHDRVLDPFGKSLFDYGTRYSQHFLSREMNRLLGVVENDCVVRGIEIESYEQINNTGYQVTVGPGSIIHDQMLFNLLTSTDIQFFIYDRFDINDVSTSQYYFRIAGDHRDKFPQFENFAVNGSTGNDDTNWIVHHTEYSGGQTYIYVASPVLHGTADGQVIHRKIKNAGPNGRLICYTKYQYLKTPNYDNFPLQICLDWLKDDETMANGWVFNENRIILGVFEVQKSADDTITIPSVMRLWTPADYESETGDQQHFVLLGNTYEVRNDIDLAENVDGGEL